jgi:hypothetical protein
VRRFVENLQAELRDDHRLGGVAGFAELYVLDWTQVAYRCILWVKQPRIALTREAAAPMIVVGLSLGAM